MRIDHYGQVLGVVKRFADGQREVALDFEAVARGIGNRCHLGHLLLLDPRCEVGQFGHRVGFHVVEVVGAHRAVAARIDDIFVFGLVPAADADFVTAQVFLHAAEHLARRLVEEMAPHAFVAFVRNTLQFFLCIAVPDAAQVVFVVGVELFQLLAGRRIHQHECRFVAPEVGDGVDQLVVRGESGERNAFLEVGRQYGTERLGFGFAVADLCVHAVDDGIGYAQLAVMVGLPALDVAGILAQHRHLARREVQAVGVEDHRVALVGADDHQRVDLFERVDDLCSYARDGRIGLRVAAVDVHAVELEILVAAGVFQIEDAVVVGPEVSGQVAFGFRGDAHGVLAVDRLHEDVAAAFVRRHVGEIFSVGRYLVPGFFRIAEEGFQRQLGGCLGCTGGQYGCRSGEHEEFFHGVYSFGFSFCFFVRKASRQMLQTERVSRIRIGMSPVCDAPGNIRCVATLIAKAATAMKMARMRMTFSISIVGVFLFLTLQTYKRNFEKQIKFIVFR